MNRIGTREERERARIMRCDLVTIDPRHPHIEKDDCEMLPQDAPEHLLAGLDQHADPVPDPVEDFRHGQEIARLVVGDEDLSPRDQRPRESRHVVAQDRG